MLTGLPQSKANFRAKYVDKVLSHVAILLATCNAILLLKDVKLENTRLHCILPMPSFIYQTFSINQHLLTVEVRRKLQEKLPTRYDLQQRFLFWRM